VIKGIDDASRASSVLKPEGEAEHTDCRATQEPSVDAMWRAKASQVNWTAYLSRWSIGSEAKIPRQMGRTACEP
jgi:hypothetical protein